MPSAVNDHAFAAILRNAKRLRKIPRKEAHPVHPRAAPEVAWLVGTAKAHVGRSVPAEIVENDGAVLVAARRGKGEPEGLNRLAAGIGQAPAQGRLGAGRESDPLAVDGRELVVPAVDEKAQRDRNAAPVALIGDHPRAQGLSGIDEGRRHEVVGAHARHVGRGESGRQGGARLGAETGVAQRERPPLLERLVYDVERGAGAAVRPEPLNGCRAGKSGIARRPLGGAAGGRPASRRPRSTRR